MRRTYHIDQAREDAPRSWWLDQATREGFAQAAEAERQRMQRSKVARSHQGMVVDHVKPR